MQLRTMHRTAAYTRLHFKLPLALLLAALLGAALFGPAANAQTCIGQVGWFPGNPVPEPHWWANAGHGVYYQSLDDPRWVGSARITYGDGTTENTTFKALQDATNLYFSWRFQHQLNGAPNNNILYVGLQPALGPPIVISMSLSQVNMTADVVAGGVANVTVNPLKVDGTLDAAIPNPAWLDNALRFWVRQSAPGVAAENTWAVQMMVPQAQLAIAASKFNMWYELLDGTPTMPVIPAAAWPRAAFVTQPADLVFPLPAAWGPFQVGGGCVPTGAVSLDLTQVGVENNSPNSSIKYTEVPPGASHPTNTFFARPQNTSGMDIDTGKITATFRIANWGSMPASGDWEVGVNVNDLWAPIQCFQTDNGGEIPTNCGTNVPNQGKILNGTLATMANEITFPWKLNNAQLQPWKTGMRTVDNCLLVQLASPLGLTFSNDSVRRNMDFVPASTFTRKAQISIKGMAPIAADGRDVYVWVETLNMPKVSTKDNQPGEIGTTVPPPPKPTPSPTPGIVGVVVLAQGQGAPPANPQGSPQATPQGSPTPTPTPQGPSGPPDPGKPIPIPDADTLAQMAAEGRVTQAQLDAAVPTYRVHVYHDTGKIMTIAGVQHPVLSGQDSFGYYISHQGKLYGWDHKLTGDGFALEQLAPNFYRIKKVPNNGVVTVITTIMAQESAPIPWWWWIVLVLILILILLWLLLRRRRTV